MTDLKKYLMWIAPVLVLSVALPVFASDPVREPAAAPDGEDPKEFSLNPIAYENEGGDFRILFPSGCGKLVSRANEPDLFGGENWDDIIQVTYVFCDRFQEEGQGCSVTSTFNLHGKDGSMAGPEHVIRRVQGALNEFGAEIIDQKVLKKVFDNGIAVEGVEVRAKSPEGPGRVWVRGLLTQGDIYILAAWNNQGGVWDDPDYVTFFNSFQPWTE